MRTVFGSFAGAPGVADPVVLAGGVVGVEFGADVVGGTVIVFDPLEVVVVLCSVVTVTEVGVVTTFVEAVLVVLVGAGAGAVASLTLVLMLLFILVIPLGIAESNDETSAVGTVIVCPATSNNETGTPLTVPNG